MRNADRPPRRTFVDVTVSSRHLDLPPALRAAAVEKIGRLDRFLEGMDRAEVHFEEERNRRIADKDVCEVTLEGHGHHVRAKVSAADPFAALDAAVAKLEHQLHTLKNKLRRRHHPRREPVAAAPLDTPEEDEFTTDGEDGEGRYRIVKTKRFEFKPMTPEEAAMQMDLLGHAFYLFHNAETGRAAVVYWRSEGDVGLIDAAN